MNIKEIRQKILDHKQTSEEERNFLATKLNIVKENSWKKYEGENAAETVENFYKSAKEQGFKFAFRSYKPAYFEGFEPELYKFNRIYERINLT